LEYSGLGAYNAEGPGDGDRTRNLTLSRRLLCPVELRRG
jgi:hypothetical protein